MRARAAASHSGCCPIARYAACSRWAAATSAGSPVEGSRNACSSATRSSASCAGSDASRGCAPSGVFGVAATVMVVDGGAAAAGGVIGPGGCEQPARTSMNVPAATGARRRAGLLAKTVIGLKRGR